VAVTLYIAEDAIRTKPGVTYGNPEYEGGGTELQLKSSLRFKNSKVSVPQGYPKGQTEDGETTEFSTEKSPFGDGRTDNYIYIKIRNIKNKMGTPYMRATMRVLFRDGRGKFCGYDPVWDVMQYLKLTGRITKSKNLYTLKVPEADGVISPKFSTTPIDYMDLKRLIYAESYRDKPMLEVCEKMKMKPVLRKLLFKEIKSFKFKELMEQARNRKPSDDDGDLED
jgi:hypothetical protein